jgi:hypothetical protein
VCHSCDAEKTESSDGGDSSSKKCKQGYGGVYGGIWQNLHLAGVWSLELGGQCAGVFGRNLASVALKTFSHLIYMKRDFINFVLSV